MFSVVFWTQSSACSSSRVSTFLITRGLCWILSRTVQGACLANLHISAVLSVWCNHCNDNSSPWTTQLTPAPLTEPIAHRHCCMILKMMQLSGWKHGSYSTPEMNKELQVNYNFVLIVAFSSLLLKVIGHGMMHHFSPTLLVSFLQIHSVISSPHHLRCLTLLLVMYNQPSGMYVHRFCALWSYG